MFRKLKLNSYSKKLKAAISVLTFFTLLQGCLTLWVANQSSFHIEKSQLSNRLLSEFIDLGGNKQRLKVWLAQFLLTNDAPVETKFDFQSKMSKSLQNLKIYLERDLALAENENERKIIIEQSERLKTLEININSLNIELGKVNKAKVIKDSATVWKFMIDTFDNLNGSDLRRLIGDAIEIQRIRAAQAEASAKSYMRYFNLSVYVLTGVTILLAIFLAYVLQKNLKKPLDNLVQAAVSVAQGDLSHRIRVIEDNEFGVVSKHFNEMTTEIEKLRLDDIEKRRLIEKEVELRTNELQLAIQKLQDSEKERRIFLANITHELKTPATAILGEAEVTLRAKNPPLEVYVDTLKAIVETGKQLSSRIEDLLLLARGENDIFKLFLNKISVSDFNKLINDMINIHFKNDSKRFTLNLLNVQAFVQIDNQRISQLLTILIENAKKYSDVADIIQITAIQKEAYLNIKIINVCPHLDSIDFSQIQNRYYRSQQAVVRRPDGLGIGLSIARMITNAHNGSLNLYPEENKYFVASLNLPIEFENKS